MKLTKKEIINSLKGANARIDEERVDMLFKYFIDCKHSLPFTQASMDLIKSESGVSMSHRHAKACVEALEKIGFKPAATEAYKRSKQGIIEQLAKSCHSDLKVITAIYDNAVSRYRVGSAKFAQSLSTPYREVSHQTVKNITHKIKILGAPVKDVYVPKKPKKVKPKIKIDVVAFDDGVIRWNPSHKLMPEQFKHLDNTW